jgi:addiction module HigA family antidote
VIRRFRHRGLRGLYEDDDRRELNPQHADKIARMLTRIDVATRPEQLDLPGFRLHPLKGELAGYWSNHRSGQLADHLPVRGGRCHGCRSGRLPLDNRRDEMTMKNPPHPGLSVRYDCIEPLGLTITEAAEALGVTRQTLNNLVNGKSGISADMAIRLDKAFGGGAETWLRLQMAYDLAQARQHEADIDVKPVSRRKLHEPHP